MKDIAVVKCYLAGNFGDDLLISHIINKTNFKEYHILENGWTDVKDIDNSKKTITHLTKGKNINFSKFDDIVHLKDISVLLNIGGSIWPENVLKNSDNSFFEGWSFVATIGNNISLYNDKKNYKKIKNIFYEKMQFVSLRDKWSAAKIDKNLFYYDPIYSMDIDKISKNANGTYSTLTFCMPHQVFNQNISKNKQFEIIFNLMNKYQVKNLNLISYQDSRDINLLNEIKEYLKPLGINSKINSYSELGYKGIINLTKLSKINFCTRHHSIIISNILGKPTIPIIYDNKNSNHIKDIKFKKEKINIMDESILYLVKDKSDLQFRHLNERIEYERKTNKEYREQNNRTLI